MPNKSEQSPYDQYRDAPAGDASSQISFYADQIAELLQADNVIDRFKSIYYSDELLEWRMMNSDSTASRIRQLVTRIKMICDAEGANGVPYKYDLNNYVFPLDDQNEGEADD